MTESTEKNSHQQGPGQSSGIELEPVKVGSVLTAGWLYRRMYLDLEYGFIGCLDDLVPELFSGDDIYDKDRLGPDKIQKYLGTAGDCPTLHDQQAWWNSETQSNWWDGVIRSAFQVNHAGMIERVHRHVERLLASQDEDGYIGIYRPVSRFRFKGENGELWAQASVFRGMLAYYECTGKAAVLEAVQRAVALTMRECRDGSNPFAVSHSVCGPEHGLVFCDVLERLFVLTGNSQYRRDAAWLYDAFSDGTTKERDAARSNLTDPDYRFKGHGVHTYEHCRAVLQESGAQPGTEQLLINLYLQKLEPCLTPGGAPIGDEYILGREADASLTGYEFCSIQELLDSYFTLLNRTGEPRWADRAEWLFLNSAQGARNPDGMSIAYCTTDNAIALLGHLDPSHADNPPEERFKHSAVHQDAAVCCAPNAGRVYPCFVQNMWQRRGDTLVASGYGASRLSTTVRGVPVTVEQITGYPFDFSVALKVESAQAIDLQLELRVPGWADTVTLDGFEMMASEGYLSIDMEQCTGRTLFLSFSAQPSIEPFGREYMVRYGPLLYALELKSAVSFGREYASGFRDRYYRNLDRDALGLKIDPDSRFEAVQLDPDPESPWPVEVELRGSLIDGCSGNEVPVTLVPMGSTVLRRVTFEPVD